ncbi:hypothetical protein CLOM_g6044 [Closterium sp. NIES-68]|nr:hypothetical protein CLOM_g6044 [Closterium sp. NIES-68]
MGTLGEICRRAADNVGKIKILAREMEWVEGAVFDLPEEWRRTLKPQDRQRDVFDIPRQLPTLVDDDVRGGRDRDNYGRFGGREATGGGAEATGFAAAVTGEGRGAGGAIVTGASGGMTAAGERGLAAGRRG